jgi:hypothetical protein
LISKWQEAQLPVQSGASGFWSGSVRSGSLPHDQQWTQKEQVA